MNRTLKLQLPSTGVLVVFGFVLGICAGIFFGEMAAALNPISKIYIRLLQMAIVPYITVSLVHGLGRLTPSQAKRIAGFGVLVLLVLITIGMVLTLLSPLAYPDWESATFFSSSLLEHSRPIDFIRLYITANPFEALANTLVPAIVLFSILMGLAVMVSEKKAQLLPFLASVEDALMIISRSIVKFAPIGIFAIAGNAAGTLDLTDLNRLQIFIWIYLALWALLFFVVLPGMMASLSSIGYREYFRAFRAPFVTAFATGSFLITLPMLIEEIRALLTRHEAADDETEAAVDVLIPTLFNFPSAAMILLLSYVLFAGWYAGSPVPASKYPLFASAALLLAFGGSNVAIPKLLEILRLPTDLFDLFLVANVINNFFFQALAASSLVVCTLLTLLLVKGRLKLRPVNLGVLALVIAVGTPALLSGLSSAFDRTIDYQYRGYEEFVDREALYSEVSISRLDYQADKPVADTATARIERIKTTRELRVGYSADALPWAFRNSKGDLVGYDIELLRRLAVDFDLSIKAVRLPLDRVPHALASDQIDIYASGLLLEPRRERAFAVSEPYTRVSLGLLVRDHERRAIEAAGRFTSDGSGRIGVLSSPSILRAIEISAPDIRAEPVASPRDFLKGKRPDLSYLVMPAESASAWAMVYPDFGVVVPSSRKVQIPMVFALPAEDSDWAGFIDQWIITSQSLGITDTAYRYWILGESVKSTRQRWSVIRDVLGWVD